MKISDKTVKILQNFSSINQGIVVRPGQILRTTNEEKSVYAEALIEETFDREFGVYDLKKLLAILSMSKTPDLTVTDTSLKVKGDRSTISVRHTNTKLIKTPPDKSIMANYLLTFVMGVSDIKWIFDTSSILGTKHIVFRAEGGKLTCEAMDVEGKVVDEGALDLGETTHTFKAVLLVERLKLMSGSYDVSISANHVVMFASQNANLRYWVALLKEPSKFE